MRASGWPGCDLLPLSADCGLGRTCCCRPGRERPEADHASSIAWINDRICIASGRDLRSRKRHDTTLDQRWRTALRKGRQFSAHFVGDSSYLDLCRAVLSEGALSVVGCLGLLTQPENRPAWLARAFRRRFSAAWEREDPTSQSSIAFPREHMLGFYGHWPQACSRWRPSNCRRHRFKRRLGDNGRGWDPIMRAIAMDPMTVGVFPAEPWPEATRTASACTPALVAKRLELLADLRLMAAHRHAGQSWRSKAKVSCCRTLKPPPRRLGGESMFHGRAQTSNLLLPSRRLAPLTDGALQSCPDRVLHRAPRAACWLPEQNRNPARHEWSLFVNSGGLTQATRLVGRRYPAARRLRRKPSERCRCHAEPRRCSQRSEQALNAAKQQKQSALPSRPANRPRRARLSE